MSHLPFVHCDNCRLKYGLCAFKFVSFVFVARCCCFRCDFLFVDLFLSLLRSFVVWNAAISVSNQHWALLKQWKLTRKINKNETKKKTLIRSKYIDRRHKEQTITLHLAQTKELSFSIRINFFHSFTLSPTLCSVHREADCSKHDGEDSRHFSAPALFYSHRKRKGAKKSTLF